MRELKQTSMQIGGIEMRYVIVLVLITSIIGLMGCSDGRVTNPARKIDSDNGNEVPTIRSLSTDVSNIAVGGVATLTCQAVDPEGSILTYDWFVSAGSIKGDGYCVEWKAPRTNGTYMVVVIVSDTHSAGDTASLLLEAHVNSPYKILVDSSRDGGVWWFPQYEGTGFSQAAPHQGKKLADNLRSQGFYVDELPRGVTITDSLLNCYDRVLVANGRCYSDSEFKAYDRFIAREGVALILASEYLRPYGRDRLAERYGISLIGIANGTVSRFANHEITDGAGPFSYIAGSVMLDPTSNPNIEVLGWLSDSDYVDLDDDGSQDPDEPYAPAVMGELHHPTAKIFFIGDLNCLEKVPQPMVDNLVEWMLN